jgi:hypothetical protein
MYKKILLVITLNLSALPGSASDVSDMNKIKVCVKTTVQQQKESASIKFSSLNPIVRDDFDNATKIVDTKKDSPMQTRKKSRERSNSSSSELLDCCGCMGHCCDCIVGFLQFFLGDDND